MTAIEPCGFSPLPMPPIRPMPYRAASPSEVWAVIIPSDRSHGRLGNGLRFLGAVGTWKGLVCAWATPPAGGREPNAIISFMIVLRRARECVVENAVRTPSAHQGHRPAEAWKARRWRHFPLGEPERSSWGDPTGGKADPAKRRKRSPRVIAHQRSRDVDLRTRAISRIR